MANLAALKSGMPIVDADRAAAFEIIREKSFKTGEEFILSSGRSSSVYFQMKYAMLDPAGAFHIAVLALAKLRDLDCDAIGGLEMGAVPVISSMAAVSFVNRRPVRSFFIRKARKEHGTRELIEGALIEDLKLSRVAVIDDVTTTGGSGLKAVGVLRDLGIEVRDAITIVDREEGATEAFAAEGIALHALFKKSEFTDQT
jgi:orotate phosphoribosyltransferase